MVKPANQDGVVHRGFRIGRLGLSLTGSYLGYQLQNVWLGKEKQGQRKQRFQLGASQQIRKELQTLKGPVMKLGQMLSSQGIFLPKESLDELAALQMHAPPMHPTLARTQFKASFGEYPEYVFKEFTRESFAAASLGQVHRAVTKKGELVAVKIQYPAIRKAVKNDFKLLRAAATTDRFTGYFPKTILDEIESKIVSETDYTQEAANLDSFRKSLKPLAYVKVPRPFSSLSTDRVLTMSFLDGFHLDDWLARNPSQDARNQLGSRLFELFYHQILVVRTLHADPHPGNYLFSDSAEIGLIDFGCVTEIAPEIAEMVRAFVDPDKQSKEERVEHLARLLWGAEPPKKKNQARRILNAALEFRNMILPDQPPAHWTVDFSDASLFHNLTALSTDVIESKLVRREVVFVKRAEIGLYNLLHRLKARVETAKVLNRILQMKQKKPVHTALH